MAEVKIRKMNDNIIVDKTLDKGKILFPEKLEKAKEHVKGRDIIKEIEAALRKEKITKL